MKKITLFALFISISSFLIAQNQSFLLKADTRHHIPKGKIQKPVHKSDSKTISTFYIDYDYAEEFSGATPQYTRYIWDMNTNYKTIEGDSSLGYMIVAFDSLDDSYDQITQTGYTYSELSSITIDSIWVAAGHQNLSGANDTIIAKIIKINNTTGYPTSTLLHADTIITNTSISLDNSWLTTQAIGFEPNYTIASPSTNHFGVKIEYHGAKADTFGIVAGFGDNGSGNCPANPSLPFFANKSIFYPTSYRLDLWVEQFSIFAPLPTSGGQDLYYECDGTNGYLQGSDSENALQNIGIWVKITVDDQLGINNMDFVNGLKLGQNVPNPSKGITSIPYQIASNSDVTIEVRDYTGRIIMNIAEGNKAAGKYNATINTSSLSNGVYFYTLNAGKNNLTKKMVIAE